MNDGSFFPVYYLCEYYPKRFAESESADSKAVLSLKNGDRAGATYFAPRVKAALGAQAATAAFVAMPGHGPFRPSALVPGHRVLIMMLDGVTDLSRYLVRTEEVPKAAAAGRGERPHAELHIKTMACTSPQHIKGLDVVLLDDVVTQGETMRAGRYHLLKAGAASVTCLAIGKTTWGA